MAALTLSDVKTIALSILDSSTDDAFFSSVSTNLANVANRDVYKEIINTCPEHVETLASITYPADTESITFTGGGYLGVDPYKWVSVEVTDASGAVSSTNPMRTVRQCSIGDRPNKINLSPNLHGYWFSLSGDKMYLTPVPTTAVYLKVRYIPQVPGMTTGSDVVLGGLAESFGDAVAMRLACLLDAKQKKQNRGSARELWAEALAGIKQGASKRYTGPRLVRTK